MRLTAFVIASLVAGTAVATPGRVRAPWSACEKRHDGECINRQINDSCDGTFLSGKCPGSADVQCCTGATGASTGDDGVVNAPGSVCERRGGTCYDVNVEGACTDGGFASGMCPGSSMVKCCLGSRSSSSTEAGSIVSDIADEDSESTSSRGDDASTPASPPISSGDLSLESLGGKRWKVSLGSKWVKFTFCTAHGTQRNGGAWPNKYDSVGPRCTDLEYGGTANPAVRVTAGTLEQVGLPAGTSWPKLMSAIAASESGNNYGNLNTYDTEIVSWGAFQFAGKRGPLAGLFAGLELNPHTHAVFEEYLGRFGLHSTYVNPRHPAWGGTVTIKVCDFRSDPGCQRSTGGEVKRAKPSHRAADRIEDGWFYLRERPDLLGLLYLAGTEPLIAAAQVKSRADSFMRLYSRGSAGSRVSDYVTSEYAVARWAYSVNGSPQGARDKFDAMKRKYPNAPWNRQQLAEYTSTLHAVPRFESGGGAELSKEPGSFRG